MADLIFVGGRNLRHGSVGVDIKIRVVAEAAVALRGSFDCAGDFALRDNFGAVCVDEGECATISRV